MLPVSSHVRGRQVWPVIGGSCCAWSLRVVAGVRRSGHFLGRRACAGRSGRGVRVNRPCSLCVDR